ncbi:MAG: cupin domain-containing protein [Oscillospiraceae bacterium]
MEFIAAEEMKDLFNPGVVSHQILNPHNSAGSRVTIAELHFDPGAVELPHTHVASEQIWYALRGCGQILLADGQTHAFAAGDAVRFAAGDIHGFENTGDTKFVYLSITSPPIDFSYAYERS